MNVNYAEKVVDEESSEKLNEEIYDEISEKYLKVLKKMRNKKLFFDSEDDYYYYTSGQVDNYLSKRHKSRVMFFKKFKQKHNLHFNTEADEMFLKFLTFMYFENSISFKRILKKICDFYNIPNNIKLGYSKKNYDNIWNGFLKSL